MSKLRHAGSPVEQPEKLTRRKVDSILWPIIVSERLVTRRMGRVITDRYQEAMTAYRADLRLDDPVLDDLIAQGKHRGPWISEVPS